MPLKALYLLAALVCALAACAGPADPPAACAAEAERLLAPLQISPEAGGPPATVLPPGRFVYPCAGPKGWHRYRYPEAGTPVDCGARSCPEGWSPVPALTERFG